MHKSIDKDMALKYLTLIGSCYASGDFEPLFPYLSSDCVWESQWRLTPENGKHEVMNYFRKKGEILIESGAFPKWMVVEFIDNMNPIRNANIKAGKEDWNPSSVALLYPAGELALFMSQDLNDYSNAMILRITVKDDLISRIDLCMPELFKFEKYDYENDSEKS